MTRFEIFLVLPRGDRGSFRSRVAREEDELDRESIPKKYECESIFFSGASIRPKPFVMKHDASMDKALAGCEKKYHMTPSCEVVLTVHHYWYQKRMVHNNGRPFALAIFTGRLQRDFVNVQSSPLKLLPDRYLFCFDAAAVKRQKAEKEERKNALMNSGGALAQKRRRRRACFNPAASKRRRKAQAEMDFATAPTFNDLLDVGGRLGVRFGVRGSGRRTLRRTHGAR